MKCIYTGSILAIALSSYGTVVQAQAPQQAGQDAHAKQTESASQSSTADQLPGEFIARQATGLADTVVVSANGESIGEINEIVHSNVDGHYYGVLQVSGVLGIGETERLIALEDLEYDADENRLYLSSSQKLEELAEFDMELFSEIDNETTVQLRMRTREGKQ
jgi:hypothetical protein